MSPTKTNTQTIIVAALVLIYCGFNIYFQNNFDSCFGIITGIIYLTRITLLSILLAIFLGRQIYKMLRKPGNINIRFVASILFLIAGSLAYLDKSTWRSFRYGESILIASEPYSNQITRLELMDDKNYYGLYGYMDWSCGFANTYTKAGDTLILNGDTFEKSGGYLSDRYLISDSVLTPLAPASEETKDLQILKIEFLESKEN